MSKIWKRKKGIDGCDPLFPFWNFQFLQNLFYHEGGVEREGVLKGETCFTFPSLFSFSGWRREGPWHHCEERKWEQGRCHRKIHQGFFKWWRQYIHLHKKVKQNLGVPWMWRRLLLRGLHQVPVRFDSTSGKFIPDAYSIDYWNVNIMLFCRKSMSWQIRLFPEEQQRG